MTTVTFKNQMFLRILMSRVFLMKVTNVGLDFIPSILNKVANIQKYDVAHGACLAGLGSRIAKNKFRLGGDLFTFIGYYYVVYSVDLSFLILVDHL